MHTGQEQRSDEFHKCRSSSLGLDCSQGVTYTLGTVPMGESELKLTICIQRGHLLNDTWAPSGWDCCYVSLITGGLGQALSSLGTTPIILAPGSQLQHVTQLSFSVYFSFILPCPFGEVFL